MLDLHAHVLPGLDDGPHDLTDALAVLRALVEDGVEAVAATPHVRDDYPTSPQTMRKALAALVAAPEVAALDIQVLPGGEIALDRVPLLDRDERSAFGLGGNPGLLLLEFPSYGWPHVLLPIVRSLVDDGVVPVIGHPERNAAVQRNPQLLRDAVDEGAVVQLTAGSVAGRFGRDTERCARNLLGAGLAHLLASDVHALDLRAPDIRPAIRALEDDDLAHWLCDEVPHALVAGRSLPGRPEPRVRGRRWRRRLRAR